MIPEMNVLALRRHEMDEIKARFGERVRLNVPLNQYTSSRLGGPADVLLTASKIEELEAMVTFLWGSEIPFIILGGGSNVLVSDAGFRGVVILNRCRQVRFDQKENPPTVWAAAGANLGVVARMAATRGFSGLEWAVGIPGTVGGAVVGNAGAHDGDMASSLVLAEILHREWQNKSVGGTVSTVLKFYRTNWTPEDLQFTYRGSRLKAEISKAIGTQNKAESGFRISIQPVAVVLTATMRLRRASRSEIKARIDQYNQHRRRTQPPGASMGSMFKNPPGDFAGRLIEAAGLKGKRIGGVGISPLHANFFINYGNGTAAEVRELIELTQKTVADRFGQSLELEIQLVGDWQ